MVFLGVLFRRLVCFDDGVGPAHGPPIACVAIGTNFAVRFGRAARSRGFFQKLLPLPAFLAYAGSLRLGCLLER